MTTQRLSTEQFAKHMRQRRGEKGRPLPVELNFRCLVRDDQDGYRALILCNAHSLPSNLVGSIEVHEDEIVRMTKARVQGRAPDHYIVTLRTEDVPQDWRRFGAVSK